MKKSLSLVPAIPDQSPRKYRKCILPEEEIQPIIDINRQAIVKS